MPRFIKLTNNMRAIVDDEDFERINAVKWKAIFNGHTWYAQRMFHHKGRTKVQHMHREILGITNASTEVDHENHNGLDNQKHNLRPCTRRQNLSNRKPWGKHPYKGIEQISGGRWRARIFADNKCVHLGIYPTPEGAAQAYDKAAKAAYGEFARLNFKEGQMTMQYSKSGLLLTERFEQCRLVAYWDDLGKVWTIGWGHTRGVYEGMACTQAQADAWLLEDLQIAIQNVNTHVKISVTQTQFDALVDFAFNCGCGNLDSSTLLKLVNAGDFEHAAAEFEKWDHAGGKVVAGLLKRRRAEEAEFLQGTHAAPQIDTTLPPVPGIPIPPGLQ